MNRKFVLYLVAIASFASVVTADERWSMIKNGGQTCWYKIQNNQVLKKCQETDPNEEIIATPSPAPNQPRTYGGASSGSNPYLGILFSGVNQASQAIVNTFKPSTNNRTQVPTQQPFQTTNPAVNTIPVSNKGENRSFPIFWILIASFVGYVFGNVRKKRDEDYIQHEAEILVKDELKKLDRNHYCVMHDITLPTEEGTTQIDHIVFSERGIFVIETKSHKGWIFGQENDGRWTQVIKGGGKYSFHNPIIQNANHIKHIGKIANVSAGLIKNIVVFTNPNVEIKSTLPDFVLRLNSLNFYIGRSNNEVIPRPRLHEIIGCIEFRRKERSHQTNSEHIDFVTSRFKL